MDHVGERMGVGLQLLGHHMGAVYSIARAGWGTMVAVPVRACLGEYCYLRLGCI
jgi:hypothetical protein